MMNLLFAVVIVDLHGCNKLNPYRCLHRDEPPLEIGDKYWKLKDSVAMYELLLLRALKFQTELILPHKVKQARRLNVKCTFPF